MKIYSCQTSALEASVITIESEMTRGFVGLNLIGNVSEVCRNGVERAKTSLETMGISLPQRRIVISIAPADLKKEGSQFDLAIAVSLALLVRPGNPEIDPSRWMFVGELGLSGDLRPVKGIVSHTLAAVASGLQGIVVCDDNLGDVECLTRFKINGMDDFRVKSFSHLRELLGWLFKTEVPPMEEVANDLTVECRSEKIRVEGGLNSRASTKVEPPRFLGSVQCLEVRPENLAQTGLISDMPNHSRASCNFDDMILSPELALAAKVIATGLHSVFLSGCPGTGKSMFAARVTSIMPTMKQDEHLDALRISSACHEKIPESLLAGRSPFRSPHHQASAAAILGTPNNPGELSLAHGGVLFLDEFPEFRRDIIEALREPLEVGEVQVSRAKQKVIWKSRVCLVTAANNCPCGWYGSVKRKCRCPIQKIANYRRKISGPIMDRIDIHINLKESMEKNSDIFLIKSIAKTSVTKSMRDDVLKAVEFSRLRNKVYRANFNRDLGVADISSASGLERNEFAAMINDLLPTSLSRRSLIRVLRVARSIADLSQRPSIEECDLKMALSWQAEVAARNRGDDRSGIF